MIRLHQVCLDFSGPPPADRARGDDLQKLATCLAGRGWQTGQSLRHRLGWTERRLRSVASTSNGQILSWPGSRGYCLTAEATVMEVEHACAALTGQSREMLRRRDEILQHQQNQHQPWKS
jgi:hypothetical protein